MHVERYGHGGTAFILLHGFPTSSFLWRHVAPELAEAGHTAFAIDLFGYGESDRPVDADFGVAAQAEYVDAAMTALRVSRGVLVGVDLGGTVALRLAATRPERVEKLVVINPPVLDELPGKDIETMQRSTARFAFRLTRGVLGVGPLRAPGPRGKRGRPGSHAAAAARPIHGSVRWPRGTEPPAPPRPVRERGRSDRGGSGVGESADTRDLGGSGPLDPSETSGAAGERAAFGATPAHAWL
jgi:pimeloyl-ACP methyl ester carboxylesterase